MEVPFRAGTRVIVQEISQIEDVEGTHVEIVETVRVAPQEPQVQEQIDTALAPVVNDLAPAFVRTYAAPAPVVESKLRRRQFPPKRVRPAQVRQATVGEPHTGSIPSWTQQGTAWRARRHDFAVPRLS